ncbi:hypothetical protein [Roseovarius sp. A46]|uniref:hypothetical protein n=1 Tax=Roseovarius sp. A46 TaxID=2109331 RepID=UPI001012D7C2|nr:hypothetical protein [Roseovarius sp. A46]
MNWAVVIAATVTLIGGVFVYRWQKETDRLTELAKERRATYREFIEAIEEYMHVFFDGDDTARQKAFSNYRVSKRKVILLGSSWVLKAIETHGKCLAECRAVMSGEKEGLMEELIENIRKSEDEIIVQMRNDFAYGIHVGFSDILPLPREHRE